MKNNFIILLFLSSVILAQQISRSDIERLSNLQLDKVKSELQSQTKAAIVQDVATAKPVSITSTAVSLAIGDFFGYNYFKKDLSFFDNIPTPADYKLGPGDEITVSLWGEKNSRSTVTLNKDGAIFYDNIGFINLSNKTLQSAEALLKEELSRIYSSLKDDVNPTMLMVGLGKLKSINIYFSGHIENPGINLVHPFSDIFSAIIQAGGVSSNGSLRKIQLIRNGNVIDTVDFYTFFMNGKKDFSSIKLIDGDVIHIPTIQRRVSISGSVIRPSSYELLNNDTLTDLVNYASGFTSSASSNVVLRQVIPMEERKSDDYARNEITININDLDSIDLNDSDSIVVPGITSVSTNVNVRGRIKLAGSYPAQGASLKDILDLAGGFDEPIFRKSIDDKEIVILRQDREQYYSLEFKVSYDESHNFKLVPGDEILVYENTNYTNNYTFVINGKVKRPGTYPFKGIITIQEAIDIAGGLDKNAFPDAISLSGSFVNSNERISGKLSNITLETKINYDSIISVPSTSNVFRVIGNVYTPGLILYSRPTNLGDAIELAGGFQPKTLKKDIYIVRANGQREKVGLLQRKSKKIFPGDSVFIPQNKNRQDFDLTLFISQISSTIANIAAIIILVDSIISD